MRLGRRSGFQSSKTALPGKEVRDTETQVARIRGSEQASDAANIPLFINARCDLFFQGPSVKHDEELLAKVIDRAMAYADAGADGLFVPGLTTISLISHLAKKSPIPLNILVIHLSPLQMLADNGVSRVSYGAFPYIEGLKVLEYAARKFAL